MDKLGFVGHVQQMTQSRLKQILAAQSFQPPRWAMIVNPFYLIRRALFVKVAEKAPNMRGMVIDVGCGSKPYKNLFTAATQYVGVDIEQSGHSHVDSQVDVFYDGKILPFGDAVCDHVVSFETFEHIFNLDEVLAEIVRVMKPGATLLISIPFGWDEHETPYDFARYTSFGIRHVLEGANLKVTDVERTNGFVAAVAQLGILYLYSITRTRSKLLNQIAQLALLFPATLVSAFLTKILPNRQSFFSGLVVTAVKQATPTAS